MSNPNTTQVHNSWSPSSWKSKPIKQDVIYEDREAVESALSKLRRLPPIVTPTEIEKLKKSLQDVALGKAFLLQGGDCAELFDYCEENAIDSKIKLLLQMSLVLIWGANKPVVRIARMAGQFAKPRSSATEVVDGVEIPSFRGDNINGFSVHERKPDPARLVSAYFHSATTLNYARAALSSGLADLHSPLTWDLGHVQSAPVKAQYSQIVSSITDSIRFMRTVGADSADQLQTVDLFTSHEALLLEYEETQTRKMNKPATRTQLLPTDSHSKQQSREPSYYNTSAHFLWIGDRTRALDGAHVEYMRGLSNPIGLKVGPTLAADELLSLLDTLNPTLEVGKVTLITRYGHSKINTLLRPHIAAVQGSRHVNSVIWQCDPMHGNTFGSEPSGLKTRRFSDVFRELDLALSIHREMGSWLGGVHLELTGEPVTECLGGSEGLGEHDLAGNYLSFCDPRLNEKQALELAFLIARELRGGEVEGR